MGTGRYDVLVKHARIVDGTGSPWYRGCVGIDDDRITAVGDLRGADGAVVVDAGDRFLAPGFIDSHVHADLALLGDPTLEAATLQGVTGHVIGQDGISYAPASEATSAAMHAYFAAVNGELPGWPRARTVAEYLDEFDGRVVANVAYLVPHGCVRHEAMGPDDRAPSDAELARMVELVEEGMRDGAVGVSTGLDYIPCRHAATDELTLLARAAARQGGVFVAHMRGYGPKVRAGMDEMYRIAREAPAAIHVSHFNVPADIGLAMVDEGRRAGLDVTFDLYPYLAGSSTLMLWLPDDLHVGTVGSILARLKTVEGRRRAVEWFESGVKPLSGVRFSHLVLPEHQAYLGMSPEAAARAAGVAIGDFLVDLLICEELRPGVVAFDVGWRTEADLRRLMVHPAQMAGSDGIYVGERPHPRGWGAFARYLATYVRDDHVMPLEDAVRRMTSFPARRFGFRERGVVAAGMHADIVLFDLDAVTERASYESGRQGATGVSHVFVNGRAVLWEGQLTGDLPGRAMRRRRGTKPSPGDRHGSTVRGGGGNQARER